MKHCQNKGRLVETVNGKRGEPGPVGYAPDMRKKVAAMVVEEASKGSVVTVVSEDCITVQQGAVIRMFTIEPVPTGVIVQTGSGWEAYDPYDGQLVVSSDRARLARYLADPNAKEFAEMRRYWVSDNWSALGGSNR